MLKQEYLIGIAASGTKLFDVKVKGIELAALDETFENELLEDELLDEELLDKELLEDELLDESASLLFELDEDEGIGVGD